MRLARLRSSVELLVSILADVRAVLNVCSLHPCANKLSFLRCKGQNSTEKSGGKKLRAPKYANNPMSFVSCGTIGNEEESATLGFGVSASVSIGIESFSMSEGGEASTSRSATTVKMKVAAASTRVAIGTFEAHTKGFGSRMMSKMGFVEGQGLGRDGQGINSPLEAVKRPKSLGLGAYAPPPAS